MVNTRDNIGHIFTVNRVVIERTPVTHNVIGPLDELGQLVNLARLDGESFKNYKHRVLDTYVHRASATYQGLINGITRELGLLQFDALTISAKSSGSTGLPESPRIVVASNEVILYNKWSGPSDYEIDKIINIYNFLFCSLNLGFNCLLGPFGTCSNGFRELKAQQSKFRVEHNKIKLKLAPFL